MEEPDLKQTYDDVEFNAGVATAYAIRTEINFMGDALFKKNFWDYLDYIERLLRELDPFIWQHIKENDDWYYYSYVIENRIYEIWFTHHFPNDNRVFTDEEVGELLSIEIYLRQKAKDLGFLMPKGRDPRWAGASRR